MQYSVNHIKSEINRLVDRLPLIETLPVEEFYNLFTGSLSKINQMANELPEQKMELMSYLYQQGFENINYGIMLSQSRNKPMGYSGDYMMIDWIYTQKTSADSLGKCWDNFWHCNPAAKAVRNRKDYFIDRFTKQCELNPTGMSLLNIASGPCRDLYEALSKNNRAVETLSIHCVDVDKNAVSYAQGLMSGWTAKANIAWEVGNVFRIRPSETYNMVWSAGLFDYLDEKFAAALAKRMWAWTKKGGKMIIGNFHPRNESRNYMEWVGDWLLIHRTEDEMLKFLYDAGIPKSCVTFEQEPLGVNIFAVISKT